jgi:hypothetical protein
VPTSIVLVSCLGDFYGTVRDALAQSYIDRIEKAGPCGWRRRAPPRGAAHHRQAPVQDGPTARSPIPASISARSSSRSSAASPRGAFWSWRNAVREQEGRWRPAEPRKRAASSRRWRRRWVSALHAADEAEDAPSIDFRELWERFTAQSEAEIPPDDQGLLDVLSGALTLAREEWAAPSTSR